MSHFVASTCRLSDSCHVDKVAWSFMDPVAALASIVIDQKNRKVHKVQFMNSEVGSFVDTFL
jgi:hypothetical protein